MGLTDRSGSIIFVVPRGDVEYFSDGSILFHGSRGGYVVIETTMDDNGRTVKEVSDAYFREHPDVKPPGDDLEYVLAERDSIIYEE